MKILAVDIGKNKSVFVDYQVGGDRHFGKVGNRDCQGHIRKAGPGLLRQLLVEISWLGVRHKTWMLDVYEHVRRGSDKRKKIAIVAVARRLLVKLWAMLRDGTPWIEPSRTAAIAAGG